MQWQDVCNVTELRENAGISVLVNQLQVAIFYLPNDEQGVYATNNFDPIAKANVLSQGVISHLNGELVVSSPLSKQHFNLYTGACVEDAAVINVPVYACRLHNGKVELDTRPIALLQQIIENSTPLQNRAAA